MALKVVMVFIAVFLAVVAASFLFINKMTKAGYGQQVREDGPGAHSTKAGTPTMGGAVFLAAAALGILLFAGSITESWLVVFVMFGCATVGFIDDYRKIAGRMSLGLKARYKLLGQLLVAVLFALLLYLFGHYRAEIILPLFNRSLNLSFFYPVFLFLLVISATNAVNITDGLDGLAAGITAIVFIAFFCIGALNDQPAVLVSCAALLGAVAGFLVFNRHPARLFMGDVGSLGLGGAVAALSVLTKSELFLIIIGGIYVIEALSVIIQVLSFQLTGKRVFLMAPLHHHFELKGWPEQRVVLVFWAVSALFALLGTLLFKYV